MKSNTVSVPSLILALLLFSCNSDKTNSDSSSNIKVSFNLSQAKSIIEEKTKKFTKAHITKDIDFLNNCFTKDARVFPPNSNAVIGKAAIAKLNTEWVSYGIHEFTETSTSLYGNEDLLIDEGIYQLRYGEDNIIDNGKYINIWKKENDDWKIHSNIWNTSLPIASDDQ